LSSRPERSGVERSAVSAVLPWKCFSTGGVMGLRPAQGDEKYLLFGNYTRWKRRPPLCHLDRSAAEWRDLRCQRSFPGNVFRPDESRAFGPAQGDEKRVLFSNYRRRKRRPPLCHLDRAQRSGEICGVSGPSLGMFSIERSAVEGPAVQRFPHGNAFLSAIRKPKPRTNPYPGVYKPVANTYAPH
jgi:hypothetical protein